MTTHFVFHRVNFYPSTLAVAGVVQTFPRPLNIVMSDLSIEGHAFENGGEGMPSALNPFRAGTSQHLRWQSAHFEGQCAAIDAGEIDPL